MPRPRVTVWRARVSGHTSGGNDYFVQHRYCGWRAGARMHVPVTTLANDMIAVAATADRHRFCAARGIPKHECVAGAAARGVTCAVRAEAVCVCARESERCGTTLTCGITSREGGGVRAHTCVRMEWRCTRVCRESHRIWRGARRAARPLPLPHQRRTTPPTTTTCAAAGWRRIAAASVAPAPQTTHAILCGWPRALRHNWWRATYEVRHKARTAPPPPSHAQH